MAHAEYFVYGFKYCSYVSSTPTLADLAHHAYELYIIIMCWCLKTHEMSVTTTSGVWQSKTMLRRPALDDRHVLWVGAHHCKLYLARTYDVSRHLAVTTHSWMHIRCVILFYLHAQWCQGKLHRVQTNKAGEKANAESSKILFTEITLSPSLESSCLAIQLQWRKNF